MKFLIFLISLPFWAAAQIYTFTQPKLGSSFSISISTKDSTGLNQSISQCYNLVDDLNQIFSDYIPSSEAMKISVNEVGSWVEVSKEMIELLEISKLAYESSKGKFDITIGEVTKEWRKARSLNKMPDTSLIAHLKTMVGIKNIEWDKHKLLVRRLNKYISLDFGGIAKGYIADKVAELLNKQGWQRYLIDAGGDMVAGNAPLDKKFWTIGIETDGSDKITHALAIKNVSVATSGSTYQRLDVEGASYSHILDPQTGMGTSNHNNITTIAKSGTQADWMATTCSIVQDTKTLKNLAKKHDTTILVSHKSGFTKIGRQIKLKRI
jgi:thiamine biosynthesis lipoprotein